MSRKRKFSISTVLAMPPLVTKKQAADSRKVLQRLASSNSSLSSSKSLTAADKPKLQNSLSANVYLDNAQAQHTFQPSRPQKENISPTRALRDAMLKRPFADTILKAQQKQHKPVHITDKRQLKGSLSEKSLTTTGKLKEQHSLDKAQLTSQTSNPVAASPQKEVLSPNRALRVVMLKSRFAETILKAQQKLHKPMHLTEKQQLKAERARFKAQAEAAETKFKIQREQQRRAARLAVDKIEKTVELCENHGLSEDDKNLGYSGFTDDVAGYHALENPLAELGLFLKKDDLDDEELDNEDLEVGVDVEKREKRIKFFGRFIEVNR